MLPADYAGAGVVLALACLPLLVLFLALLFLLLLLLVAAGAASAVAEVLDAVGGELGFMDRLVVGALEGFGVVFGIHHEEIVIAREDDGFVVGGDGGPGGFAFGRLVEEGQLAGGEFVLEGELLLVARGRRREVAAAASTQLLLGLVGRIFLLLIGGVILLLVGGAIGGGGCSPRGFLFAGDGGVAGDVDFELNGRLVFDEADGGDGKMLGVVGKAGGGGEGGGEFRGLEDHGFGLFGGVHDVEPASGGAFEAVPEAVAGVHPMRRDGGIEDDFADFGGAPARRQFVIGLDGFGRQGVGAHPRNGSGDQREKAARGNAVAHSVLHIDSTPV